MRLGCSFKGLVRITFVPAVTVVTAVALASCGGSSTNGATAFVPGAPVKVESAIPKAYVLTDLGAGLPGSPGLVPAAINNQGVVVGEASVGVLGRLPSCSVSSSSSSSSLPLCGPPEGWIFKNGTLSELPPLPGDSYTFADDVNGVGMVAGGSLTSYSSSSSSSNYLEKAVLWGINGRPIDLGTGFLGSQSNAEATAISDLFKIVGYSYDIFTGDEIPTGFDLLGGTTAPCGRSTEAVPSAINNAGLLIGTMLIPTSSSSNQGEAAIECPPLVTIETPSNPTWDDYGFGINDRGQAVGRLTIGPGLKNFHPFLYYKGATTDLGTLFPGNPASVGIAFSINQSGTIAGFSAYAPYTSSSGPTQPEAFVYADGQMVDLNTLLPASVRANWTLVVARAINDRNQIVGSAFVGGYPNGVEHGFLLTPKGRGPWVVSKARFVPGNGPTVRPTRAQWTSMEALRAKLRLQR
jgi:probable HAF family extracellular repeat protein